MFAFWSNSYTCWSPASLEVVRHHLLIGSRKQSLFFFLCLCTTFSFALVNCLNLQVVFHLIFSPQLGWEAGVVEQLGDHRAAQHTYFPMEIGSAQQLSSAGRSDAGHCCLFLRFLLVKPLHINTMLSCVSTVANVMYSKHTTWHIPPIHNFLSC